MSDAAVLCDENRHKVHCQRILDEWKANIDLQKFHDTLKHQRISHFLTIQVALIAVAGLLIRESTHDARAWIALLLPSVIGAALALMYLSMDLRARAYIDVVKSRLLLLEREWNLAHESSQLTTYTDQRLLLSRYVDEPSLREARLKDYIDVRRFGKFDTLEKQLQAPAAHLREKLLFIVLLLLWLTATVFAAYAALSLR